MKTYHKMVISMPGWTPEQKSEAKFRALNYEWYHPLPKERPKKHIERLKLLLQEELRKSGYCPRTHRMKKRLINLEREGANYRDWVLEKERETVANYQEKWWVDYVAGKLREAQTLETKDTGSSEMILTPDERKLVIQKAEAEFDKIQEHAYLARQIDREMRDMIYQEAFQEAWLNKLKSGEPLWNSNGAALLELNLEEKKQIIEEVVDAIAEGKIDLNPEDWLN